MDITEVRIKLMDESSERLRAFCSITLDDCFVVRDLKIIEGASGPFVAMPSRKLSFHCRDCGAKNHLRAVYCNQCGATLRGGGGHEMHEGRVKLYADIAHPINSHCRELIQDRVIDAYEQELDEAKQPGYRSRYDEYGDEWEGGFHESDIDFIDESETGESEGGASATGRQGDADRRIERETSRTKPDSRSREDERDDVRVDEPQVARGTARGASEQSGGPHRKPALNSVGAKTEDSESDAKEVPWRHRPPDDFGAGVF